MRKPLRVGVTAQSKTDVMAWHGGHSAEDEVFPSPKTLPIMHETEYLSVCAALGVQHDGRPTGTARQLVSHIKWSTLHAHAALSLNMVLRAWK